MTRTARLGVTAAGIVSAVVVATLGGCSLLGWLDDPGSALSPAPTVASPATSTPSSITDPERQADYDAAMAAYRAADTELTRQARLGTAELTSALKASTAGAYRKSLLRDLDALASEGWRADGPLETTVAPVSWSSPTRLTLRACEDASRVRLLDRTDTEVSKDRPRLFLQELTAEKTDGTWRITNRSSTVLDTFDHTECRKNSD